MHLKHGKTIGRPWLGPDAAGVTYTATPKHPSWWGGVCCRLPKTPSSLLALLASQHTPSGFAEPSRLHDKMLCTPLALDMVSKVCPHKCRLPYPHFVKQTVQESGYQLIPVSAVKMCNQCLLSASHSATTPSPQIKFRASPQSVNGESGILKRCKA